MILLEASAAVAAIVVFLSWCGAYVALSGGKHIPTTVRPEDLGLPYEPVAFRSADGVDLKGWFVPAASESSRTIIFCHGWGANKGEVLKDTYFLRDRGFNLLYFDFRCCGESSGSMMSVGALEARDFDAAVAFIKKLRPNDRLAVYGISMGSMVAFAGVARHEGFSAAVLECAFASHDQALARYARHVFYLTYYPFMPLIYFFVRRRLGFDPEVQSPERLAGRIGDIPVLLVYGEKDLIAIPEIGRSLIQKVRGPKELWVVPGAGHAKCADTAGPAYREKLGGFYSLSLS
jgi:pimeloyl-ACP methyl ester carboxylesterase